MRSLRLAAVYALPAVAILVAWVRIEQPANAGGRAIALALLALVPALVPGWRLRIACTVVVVILGSWLALGASLATPGRIFTRSFDGAREFYDVDLPFDPTAHPRMQGAILLAIFAFCLLLALALAARRALLAVAVLALGAGWPGTLMWGGRELLIGGLILAAGLVILAGNRPRASSAFFPAVVAGAFVVALALGLVSRPAVAKGELLHWQGWDLYTQRNHAVGVSYVWDSNYAGLDWPKKKTVVLKIEAPDDPFYWRATTLDAFIGDRWRETFTTALAPDVSEKRLKALVPQQVSVEALRDPHLIGADRPVVYRAPGLSVSYARAGVAFVDADKARGKTYTAWSSVQRLTARQLARAQPLYPDAIRSELDVALRTPVPPFGTPGRDAAVKRVLADRAAPYARLYDTAKRVVGRARTPYAAVVALESWFRDSGTFAYDEHPPSVAGVPPLVSFVTEARRGYCQHFAGAMALMLRYLGIPARVAAGFASGTYSNDHWTVTDHDAHAWVEVWFKGYGWLPFDPTPGRARLGASYSASSKSFDPGTAAALVGAGSAIKRLLQNEALSSSNVRGEHARSVPVASSSKHRTLLIVALLLAVLLVLGAGLFAFKALRRRARYRTADPRAVAAACRRELSEILLDQKIEVPRSATLHELGQLLDRELEVGGSVFVEVAGSARFAAPDAAAAAARRARNEARELRRVLRRRLSTFERLSGALSLRSLRSA